MTLAARVSELREGVEALARQPDLALPSAPVFVIGSPRSGTAELAFALAEHPELWTGGDSSLFYPLLGADEQGQGRLFSLFQRGCPRSADGTPAIAYPDFARWLGHGLDRLFLSRSGGRRWIDSSPENLLVAQELVYMFPRARFLLLERDGRALVRSAVGAGVAWAPEVERAAATWAHFARQGRAFAAANPDRVLRARVEDVAARPEEELARLYAFLCEEPCAAAARYLRLYGMSWMYGVVDATPEGGFRTFDVPLDGGWDRWSSEDRGAFERAAGAAQRELAYP